MAVFQAAAVFVIALVGAFGNELIDQIAFAAHDLNAVVPSLLRQLCAAYVVLYGLFDFAQTQCTRSGGIDGGLYGRRGNWLAHHGIAACMQNLHANLGAILVHGIGNHFVPCGFFIGGEFGAFISYHAICIGRNAASDD